MKSPITFCIHVHRLKLGIDCNTTKTIPIEAKQRQTFKVIIWLLAEAHLL